MRDTPNPLAALKAGDNSAMIERVARAIRESGEGDLSPMVYVDPTNAALAAIAAMRETAVTDATDIDRLRSALQYVVDWHGTRDNYEKLLPPDQQNDEIRLAMLALGGQDHG